MKNITFLIFVLALLFHMACTKTNSVHVDIPNELKENQEAVALIDEMAQAVAECQTGMQEAVKLAIKAEKGEMKKDKEGNMKLSQMIKPMLSVAKITSAKKDMDAIKEKAKLLHNNLSPIQISALDTVLQHLEKQIGDIDTEALGLSEQELQKLKDGGSLDFGTEKVSPEKQARMDSLKEEQAYIEEQHRLHDEYLKSQGLYEEPKPQKSNEIPAWLGFAFVIIVAVFIITVTIWRFIRFIKGVKNKVQDISYAKNDISNKLTDIKSEIESDSSKKEQFTDEEKQSFEALEKFLNK